MRRSRMSQLNSFGTHDNYGCHSFSAFQHSVKGCRVHCWYSVLFSTVRGGNWFFFLTMSAKLFQKKKWNPPYVPPSRLLQVWQLCPWSGPHWWPYRIRATEWYRSPDGRGSRTKDAAPTTSPDFGCQARAARFRRNHRPSTAASSPGTRHGYGHGHGARPGQARADGTSRWTHGASQADRTNRNHTTRHGECRGKLMENKDQILSGCFVVDLLKIWHEKNRSNMVILAVWTKM